MDTGSRLTYLAIVSPSSLLKELKDPFLQDPAGEEPEETLNQTQTCERDKTAPSTRGEEMKGERQYKEVELSEKRSCSQAEADPRASTKKKRVKKGLAKRVSKSGTSQVVVSGVKEKQGKMSRRRLLLRKKYYYSFKKLGHKK